MLGTRILVQARPTTTEDIMFDNDLDIIEERDGYRVRLEYDDSPEQPYDDGATPIFTIERSGYGEHVEAFNRQAEPYVDAVSEMMSRFGLEELERFARIFYGAVKFESWYSEGISGYYVAFDTEEWRAEVGVTPEILKDGGYYLTEVRAWAEGDVYGYIVEKNVNYKKVYDDPEMEDEDGEEWVEVAEQGTTGKRDAEGNIIYFSMPVSVWGHYGREWAEQAAREALADVLSSVDR
jgi:hypothetical protein